MKEKKFTSGALQVNLAETLVKEIVIPGHHLEIIELSKDQWGIHKRTRSFFEELNHPYANYKVIAEEYRKILLGDRWLYEQTDDPAKAVMFFLDLASDLMKQPIKYEEASQLLKTYLEYFGHDEISLKPYLQKLTDHLFNVLNELLKNREMLLVRHSDLLKKHLGTIAAHDASEKKLLNIVKQVAAKSIGLWRETSQAETWFGKRKHLFTKDYTNIIREIGKVFLTIRSACLTRRIPGRVCVKMFSFIRKLPSTSKHLLTDSIKALNVFIISSSCCIFREWEPSERNCCGS
jgi:pyruvate, orthophosphate dikinase